MPEDKHSVDALHGRDIGGGVVKTAREIAEMVNHGNDVDDFERYIEYCTFAADSAIEQERERCAKIAEKWTRADHICLHAGEMTASELRSVKAVVNTIIRELKEWPRP